MKIEYVRRLRGPNVYLSRPAMVARLCLDELTGRETSEVTGFAERLLRALPGLAEHHCAAGAPGGFVSRLRGGTYFGHVTEHVCLTECQRVSVRQPQPFDQRQPFAYPDQPACARAVRRSPANSDVRHP